jgi:decaprenylphosphoryl-5-phosphoribose phosphatase
VPTLLSNPKPRARRVLPSREPGCGLRGRARSRRRPERSLRLAAARLDRSLLVTMRTRGHLPVAERLAQGLGAFGEFGTGWAALGGLGAAASRERRSRFLAAAAAAPAAIAVNYAVKALAGRERPVVAGHPPLGPATSRLSFPSAHATSSFAGAVALGRVAPRARLPLLGLAALICAGRPYLGMHYPSDVAAGAALGWSIGRLWPLPGECPSAPRSPEEPR